MSIGVFLLGGLFTIVQNTRATFTTQNQLAQLQDNERLAMSLIADVIESAGYYPDPTSNTAQSALPVVGTFATAGQGIVGTPGAAPPGDTITVRFMTAPNDGLINCTGGSNATVGPLVYTNAMSVDASGNLACKLNGAATATPLVSGLTNMTVLYGVKTDFAQNNGAVDSYLTAAQLNGGTGSWSNVVDVQVTLTFLNPLSNHLGQPPTITFQRVIAVMAQTGAKT